ncbi:WD40 repeat-like protein [Agrocybe pediades]|nr:WD40 repeat-like protein [Agrocybe pediades]
MVQARRRVSYVIPPPTELPPRLQLPPYGVSRLGATGPLLTTYHGRDEIRAEEASGKESKHPRHRLGVASLALDMSTQLLGRKSPEGILYSGGRDGLIMSWELGIPMIKKRLKAGALKRGRWEQLTGWADDSIEEENEEEAVGSDGDVLGEVTMKTEKRRRAASLAGEIPPERHWETDMNVFKPKTRSQFRQASQAHTDWVNDIILCNYNQTVVSASSDGTVKAWNPHATAPTDPSTIGSHGDYVRCLTYCREQNWVASGSFDRTIKIWDLGRSSTLSLVSLNPPDANAPKSSVYALASDPFGRTIASGSPERVIRLWDPRTGRRTGKLVGHTDNIRAILISEDSKYLLTGSADASIKLWSLATQRCLHTFAHHADSVWSLFSDHPSLEVFYSGDKSGLVCRVDVEDCSDVSEGECLVICNDSSDSLRSSSEGINKIVVMDDNLLWTASGTSTIRRWNIPQTRSRRAPPLPTSGDADVDRLQLQSPSTFKRRLSPPVEAPSEASTRPSTSLDHSRRMSLSLSVHSVTSEHWRDAEHESKRNGLPYESLVKLVSPNDPFMSFSGNRVRDPDVATLYSAASIMSVPRQNRSPPAMFSSSSGATPLHTSRTEETVMVNNSARAEYEERELAADATPFCAEPDDVIPGDHGLVRSVILNDKITALTVNTEGEVAVWDIARAKCLGRYLPEDVAAASHSGSATNGSEGRERSPREALEAVRERIEGEAVVSSWCSAGTKGGVLTILLERQCFEGEVYADEVGFLNDPRFNDDSKINIAKWVLRNLFYGFIEEELRRRKAPEHHPPHPNHPRSSQDTIESRLSQEPRRKHSKPVFSGTVICSPHMIPAVPPAVSPIVRSSPLLTPLIPLYPSRDMHTPHLPPIPQSPPATSETTPTPGFHQRMRSGTVDGSTTPAAPLLTPSTGKDDYFSSRARQQGGGVPGSPDDFSGWSNATPKPEPQTPSTPGGLMGRLRNFGKMGRRPVSDIPSSANPGTTTPTAEVPVATQTAVIESPKTPVQKLLSGPLNPPSSQEAPLHALPPDTMIIISEEAQPSNVIVYRRNVSDVHHDVETLEEAMPMWLAECLLLDQIPTTSSSTAKLSFVLMPWNKDPDMEPLPELLNTLVQDKLTRMSAGSRAGSVRSSFENTKPSRPKAEDEFEILCNDTLLPLGMSLAAVRMYVWRQTTELVMHYRRKKVMAITGQ